MKPTIEDIERQSKETFLDHSSFLHDLSDEHATDASACVVHFLAVTFRIRRHLI